MVKPQSEGNNTVDADGNPLWRMAPSPHGPYWEEGQKLGYQDAGSWTLSSPPRLTAARRPGSMPSSWSPRPSM
jgi:glycerol transport system substrate-binding protein